MSAAAARRMEAFEQQRRARAEADAAYWANRPPRICPLCKEDHDLMWYVCRADTNEVVAYLICWKDILSLPLFYGGAS